MKHPILCASRREMIFGWRYLAFQTVFLGYFLSLAVRLFSLPWGGAEINLAFFCLNFSVVLICFRRFLLDSARLARKRISVIVLTAAVGFLAYHVLSNLVSTAIAAIEPGFSNVNDQNISAISREHYVLMAVGTVLLVPVTEEVLHRGVVFGSLYARSRLAAYLVSTVLFSLVHISGYIGHYEPRILFLCFLQYVPAGICLAASYEISGCIAAPILIHTAVNAIGILAMR